MELSRLQTGRGREDSWTVLQVFSPHGSRQRVSLSPLWFGLVQVPKYWRWGVSPTLTHIELALTHSPPMQPHTHI